MIREPNFLNIAEIIDTVQATFKRRGTKKVFALQFDKTGMHSLQTLWSQHLRGLGVFKEHLNFPAQMGDVLAEINAWLKTNKIF